MLISCIKRVKNENIVKSNDVKTDNFNFSILDFFNYCCNLNFQTDYILYEFWYKNSLNMSHIFSRYTGAFYAVTTCNFTQFPIISRIQNHLNHLTCRTGDFILKFTETHFIIKHLFDYHLVIYRGWEESMNRWCLRVGWCSYRSRKHCKRFNFS